MKRADNGEVPERLTEEEIQRRIAIYEETSGNISATARRLGIKRASVQGLIRRLKSQQYEFKFDGAKPNPQPEPTPQERSTIQGLRDEIARLKSELRAAYRAGAEEDAILNLIGIISKAAVSPPTWLNEIRAKNGKSHPEVPIANWGDWHWGEVIRPGAVNGFNEFNREIARERVRRLVANTIDLCRNHGPGNYPGIVVNLIGDFISGGLHPELAKSDELARIPAALEVRDVLVWALEQIADEFGSVFVPCVSGNHGRDTPKPEYKGYLHHNFDWLIYQLLRRHFENDKRLTFLIEPSNEAYYSVFGLRTLLVHGDMLGVKGGDGIIGSIGPIMRGEIKTRGQASSLGRPFDILIMGHWHQELWLPRAIVNNALKGFDEYAKDSLRAVPSEPSQSLFFVHQKGMITSRWSVRVDELKARENHGWVAVPSAKETH
ncbi:hypothetical protein [Mesorhizobium sp. B2-8-9]|uniref:hypothetical protein n=1 Tax=Mesorhizobium sp. B2-8-9 TaxID=2589899 RepID=UPI00112A0910|nr:hypothetical protein [Mesorhizobium sp. B2-8-9]TPI86376.1 hypothetical protein FJ423_00705 [Mesorhizobium sp. B2-8-9]